MLDAAKAATENKAKQSDYDAALRKSVADVVKQQAEVGIDIVNDGEFGKSSWANYILERISGFEIRPDQLRAGRLARPRPRALPRVHRRGDAARR